MGSPLVEMGRYCPLDNEELIARVELLWMVTHQITQVPCTWMINNADARGIVYEQKEKQVNWCMFGKWTICDRFWKLQSYERALSGKPSIVELA